MVEIKEMSREFTKVEKYLMTTAPDIEALKNITDGESISGEEKRTSKGFKRQKAKLFLNNLYGKFAMSDNSSYKEPYLDDDGIIRFILHEEHEKKVGYIPIGSAITSYAMNFTIRHAMANYDRFCYADTDSIHLIGLDKANEVKSEKIVTEAELQEMKKED